MDNLELEVEYRFEVKDGDVAGSGTSVSPGGNVGNIPTSCIIHCFVCC